MKFFKPSRALGLGAFAAAALTTAYFAHNRIGPDQFGMKESFGVVSQKTLPSGIYGHFPYFQYTHSYQKGVQRIEFNAGGCRFVPLCPSTKDGNRLTASLAFNYTVNEDTEKLGLHRWSMDGWVLQDGYWLLTRMMNDSANSVLGQSNTSAVIGNADEFLELFTNDFSLRLQQNNVPVTVRSTELRGFSSFWPMSSVSYAARKF